MSRDLRIERRPHIRQGRARDPRPAGPRALPRDYSITQALKRRLERSDQVQESALAARPAALLAPEEEALSIDIGTFAAKVARLAEMPEKVLDLKSAIINRAVQYLQENYDDNVAKDFEEALLDRFQMAVPETEIENLVAADLPAPPAVGAGSGGAAGG